MRAISQYGGPGRGPRWLGQLNPIWVLRHLGAVGSAFARRASWFLPGMTLRRGTNLVLAAAEWLLARRRPRSRPPVVKIDISPLCNLRCTVCVHAYPGDHPLLKKQRFHAGQRMDVQQFTGIVEQIRRHTSAVSLYYLGDPLTHPDLDTLCHIAANAGLSVHISTNFSFRLSDLRLRSLLDCGLTHLTVCMDGMTQENYRRTRVGGRIEWVLDNLRRACQFRNERGGRYPLIEVQYIQYQHNAHETESARQFCQEIGVDQFCSFWGELSNYADASGSEARVRGPKARRWLPLCCNPYFYTLIKYNGDVIPCCHYRLGSQYAEGEAPPVLGNVFQTPLEEIWRSAAYQRIRALVCDPGLADRDPSLRDSFCYGCGQIYELEKSTYLGADRHAYESVYRLDDRGVPQRLSPRRSD